MWFICMISFLYPALCPPGYFGRKRKHWKSSSIPGLTPCTTCDYGTYQPKPGQTECSHCPGNWTTLKRGSIDLSDCKGNLQLQQYKKYCAVAFRCCIIFQASWTIFSYDIWIHILHFSFRKMEYSLDVTLILSYVQYGWYIQI
jgi:hypothetical protein